MIIDIPDEDSVIRWKYSDNEDWKSAEISDLIKAYERPKVTVFAENASKEEIEDFKQELENVLERPQGEWLWRGNFDGNAYICSNCSKCSDWHNFCPNCGASMKKGGAEND